DRREVRDGRQLARGVADEGHRELRGRDAAAIIADAHRGLPRSPHVDGDAGGAGIESILEELLHDRSGAFDDLARRDRVGHLRSQHLDQGANLARSWYSFWRASRGLSDAGSISSSSCRSGSGTASMGSPNWTSGGSSGRCRSRSASTSRARAITPPGKPARAATWIPYERSAPPGTTRWRKRTVSPSSRTSTRWLRTRGRRSASAVS